MTYNTTTAIESSRILDRIGTPTDTSISNDISAVSSKIGTPNGASVSIDIQNIKSVVDTVSTNIGSPSNTSISNDIKANKIAIDDVSTKIGTSSDGSTSATVFGKLASNISVLTQLQSSMNHNVNINYLTNYRVELVNIPSGATYTYKYMVKVLYAGIFEASGSLCSNVNGTEITDAVITDTILSNGLLYDKTYYNPYRIEKYDNSKKVIYLRNELTDTYFYIKLNSIVTTSGFNTTALEYNTKTNTITTDSSAISDVINAYIPFITTSLDTYKLDKLFVKELPTYPYSTLAEKIPCCTLEKAE